MELYYEKNNDMTIEEKKKKLISEVSTNDYGYYDFDGQNCDVYSDTVCPGWDGENRRCACGNRRVSWEFDNDDNPTNVWAEAW